LENRFVHDVNISHARPWDQGEGRELTAKTALEESYSLDFMAKSDADKKTKKRKDPEQARRFWESTLAMAAARDMNESALSNRAFGNRTHISSARSNGSMPDKDGLVAIANALDVSLDVLVGRQTESGADPSTTLLGFLHDVDRLGIAAWAAQAARTETPTLVEAAKALRLLKENPAYSASNGAPIDGWALFFAGLRANDFKVPAGARRGTADATVAKAIDDPIGGHKTLDPHSPRRRK
jgi:transcriptional regulator with XRE-family HTH domain